MATYYEITAADLSKLTTAADDWAAMAEDFGTLVGTYRREVHGISLGDTWVGISANAGSARFDVTLKEYQGAQREAKAAAKLFRDAHAEFNRLRKQIEHVREDAVKAGMKVSDKASSPSIRRSSTTPSTSPMSTIPITRRAPARLPAVGASRSTLP
ncbi:hypothetical protein [Streptomyces sp. NPDC058695]|uniref:hypothetical protein n=1 Tax=Streptomyces sp. NPDC058695 TaxID=3346604 RepID=UPI00364E2EB6